MQVMIVEDESASRLMMEQMLTSMGHEVLGASNGEEAYRVYLKNDIRLVITDWVMPFLDGLDLTRRIRRDNLPRYTYVIMVSVKSGKLRYLEAMEAGIDDFLTKPVDIDELRSRIRVAERILARK